MSKGQDQNNGLRMVLFYITCAVLLVVASYGGLYFTFNNIQSGIENNDKDALQAGINFHQLEGAIRTQMPENLVQVKVNTHSLYSNSSNVVSKAPQVDVNADTIVDLVKKTGICAAAGQSSGYDANACDMNMESMAYSHINYKLVNKAHKDIWVRFTIAKDKSIIVWRLMSATLSKPALARIRS